MSLVLADGDTGEIVELTEDEHLEALASRVRAEYRRSREAMGEAVDAYFAIGTCLMEAREALPSTQAFGEWFRVQEFGFTTQWAGILRQAAEYEPFVRKAIETQLSIGKAPNIEKAVKQAVALEGGGRNNRPTLQPVPGGRGEDTTTVDAPAPSEFPAIVIDPPWRYDNVATRGAAEDHYPTMGLDELAAIELPAAKDAHLYLWVTNGFLRQGFDLLDAWDFTYKACLTWVKPQIGMGNYFRNNTEHVLFGIKGSLPTNTNNTPTAFKADRTRHSAKPESFYDIVEASSPGPWLEMFARRRRFGWHVWGNGLLRRLASVAS